MSDAPVDVLRRFNRSFTSHIGVLDESFLGTGRSLAVARMLFEIGLHDRGVTVQSLREGTGADSGYLSRLLRTLEADGLIALVDDPTDGRRRIAELTATGREAWTDLDERSDRIAVGLLGAFTAEQADRLADALNTADRLLRCASIESEIVDPASDRADAAMRRYFDELDRRFVDGFEATDDSSDERKRMTAPRGAFLVMVEQGEIVGCGGVYRRDDRTAEIKRMWLDQTLRGLGMGKRLLAELETVARSLGCIDVVLDTNATLEEAIAMYVGAGYVPTDRYNENPYAELWFRKRIEDPLK